jgi:uncharacterized Zn-binding protein involved in type VI secretion
MGQPAARITDMHVCPQVTPGTPPVPHVGGPIQGPCQLTVLVGNLADARIGDISICVGPPDPIAQGSSTVLVGGLPSSRLADSTSHGGIITVGWPTVLIGGAAVTINISGDAAFAAQVQAALAQILPTRTGVEWLRQMGLNGRAITIQPTNVANGFCGADDAANMANGVGSNSTISWNPNHNTTDAGLPGAQGNPGSAMILGHEMIHALHNANGDNRDGPDDSFPGQSGSSARNEERSTVGTSGPIRTPGGTEANPPNYSNDVPTENSLRSDLGIPPRPTYYPSNWPGGAPW